MSTNNNNTVNYTDGLYERLRNQEYAKVYLQTAYDEYQEDGHLDAFLLSLGNVAKAHGMGKIAKESGKNRESLYKSLSPNGNPEFQTIDRVMHNLGFKFNIERIDSGSYAA